MKIKAVTAGVAVAVAALAAAGCSSGVNHDSQNPQEDIQFQWVRIETPPSFHTFMFGCLGSTGLYIEQGDANISQITSDPLCPISRVFDPAVQAKYHFKLVTRTGHNGAGNS